MNNNLLALTDKFLLEDKYEQNILLCNDYPKLHEVVALIDSYDVNENLFNYLIDSRNCDLSYSEKETLFFALSKINSNFDE